MIENAQSEHHTYLMTGYILNTLSTEEKAEFEQCLQETPALGYELQQLQEVMGLLAHTVPQTTAPDQLRNKGHGAKVAVFGYHSHDKLGHHDGNDLASIGVSD